MSKQAVPAVYKTQAFKAKIVILNGPLEGRSFKLISNQILIGRALAENDIVLDYDMYCSRKHALILKDSVGEAYYVQKISKKTPLFLNQKEIKDKKKLKHNDILTVGETQLQIHILKKSELAIVPPDNQMAQLSGAHVDRKSKSRKKSPLTPSRLILLLVILAGVYFSTMEDSTEDQKDQIKLRTEQDFEDALALDTQLKIEKEKEIEQINTPAYKNAQIAYLRGIRDYRQGLFGRAIENFRVCRTLFPKHKLCSGYLKKSQMKYEQLAQKNLILGKSYMEKKQYRQCSASFKTVMTMMSFNKNSKLYKEAQQKFLLCEKSRQQYPRYQ